jgi:hypothetical protein
MPVLSSIYDSSDFTVGKYVKATALAEASKRYPVIPVQAGIHKAVSRAAVLWIPAFAGMTVVVCHPLETLMNPP